MKKLFVGVLSMFILGVVFANTDDVDHFVVNLTPNPIKVNVAGDLIIKAVDAEGDIVEDYIGEIYIEVPELDSSDYKVPGEGFYSFETDDQGEVILSKGTEFYKGGEFDLVVYDLFEETKRGVITVTVQDPEGSGEEGSLEVVSPIAGSTEKTSILSILGKSDKPNSPLEIYIDGEMFDEDLTDENGDFNVSITDIEPGEHELEVKISKVGGIIVAESGKISFSYNPVVDDKFYKTISIEPANVVSQDDNVYIRVTTIESASSVKLVLKGIGEYLMESVGDGEFTKNLAMNLPGTYDISLTVTAGEEEKDYPNVEQLKVVQGKAILTSKLVRLEETADKATLTWDYEGDINNFKVIYGLSETDLDKRVEVTTGAAELVELNPASTYYYQILPLNASGDVDGEPSKVLDMPQKMIPAPDETCVVKGIKIKTQIIGGKNYLVWDEVEGATKYIVYKSEENVSGLDKMQKVAETTKTRFEYPFDNASEEEIYNYYGVEAVCGDGETAQLDNVKKIQVGPLDSFLVLLLISAIGYLMYKLYRYSD